jgi:membrane protein implicated in regulation of membrane protease activity
MDFFIDLALFWFLLGIFFLLIELLHYGFIFFFFGIGALITSLITWLGITDSLSIQIIIFIASSVISLILFRRKLSKVFKGKVTGKISDEKSIDDIKGERVIVVSDIIPNSLGGKVEFHGTVWEASADVPIKKGQVVEIVDRVVLTLKVKPINN